MALRAPDASRAATSLDNQCEACALQALVGTEHCEGTGATAAELFWGGTPAPLHLLAAALRFGARAIPHLARAQPLPPPGGAPPASSAAAPAPATGGGSGGCGTPASAARLATCADVIVGLAGAAVRALDTRGPLARSASSGHSRDGKRDRDAPSAFAVTGGSGGRDAHLGPGFHCATWGFGALAAWAAAADVALSAVGGGAAGGAAAAEAEAWAAMASAVLRAAPGVASSLLLRAAEEVVAAARDPLHPQHRLCAAAAAGPSSAFAPLPFSAAVPTTPSTATSTRPLKPGGLSLAFQQQQEQPQLAGVRPASTAVPVPTAAPRSQQEAVARLDAARHRLAVALSTHDAAVADAAPSRPATAAAAPSPAATSQPPPRHLGRSGRGAALPPQDHLALCVALAQSLRPFIPGALHAALQQPNPAPSEAPTPPAAAAASATVGASLGGADGLAAAAGAACGGAAPEEEVVPWGAWHASGASWAAWEGAVLARLRRDARGCCSPLCANALAFELGMHGAMSPCGAAGAAGGGAVPAAGGGCCGGVARYCSAECCRAAWALVHRETCWRMGRVAARRDAGAGGAAGPGPQ